MTNAQRIHAQTTSVNAQFIKIFVDKSTRVWVLNQVLIALAKRPVRDQKISGQFTLLWRRKQLTRCRSFRSIPLFQSPSQSHFYSLMNLLRRPKELLQKKTTAQTISFGQRWQARCSLRCQLLNNGWKLSRVPARQWPNASRMSSYNSCREFRWFRTAHK